MYSIYKQAEREIIRSYLLKKAQERERKRFSYLAAIPGAIGGGLGLGALGGGIGSYLGTRKALRSEYAQNIINQQQKILRTLINKFKNPEVPYRYPTYVLETMLKQLPKEPLIYPKETFELLEWLYPHRTAGLSEQFRKGYNKLVRYHNRMERLGGHLGLGLGAGIGLGAGALALGFGVPYLMRRFKRRRRR